MFSYFIGTRVVIEIPQANSLGSSTSHSAPHAKSWDRNYGLDYPHNSRPRTIGTIKVLDDVCLTRLSLKPSNLGYYCIALGQDYVPCD